MFKNLSIKKIVLSLMVVIGLGTASNTAFAGGGSSFTGEYRQGEILSFGSSLNKSEESALRDYFGVSADMEAIYVDNATAIEQLGLEPNALDNYTGGWYSSAYVKLTDKGGVLVTSKNVSLVTNEMFANALITSGILNCEVNVSAPFMVTGESALAGILAGAEEIMGESLSEENKVVAKEEIDTTLEIADEILNDDNNEIDSKTDSSTVASGIINDIKEQVIKDSPNSTQIQEIIVNVTNNYGVELSEETEARVLSLMEDVNKLDIDYKDIKDTMNNIGESISNSLKEAGVKLQESGFFEKIFNWFGELLRDLVNWVEVLFAGANEVGSADTEGVIAPEVDSEQQDNATDPSTETDGTTTSEDAEESDNNEDVTTPDSDTNESNEATDETTDETVATDQNDSSNSESDSQDQTNENGENTEATESN